MYATAKTIFLLFFVLPTQMLVILPHNRCSRSVSLSCSSGAGHAVECAGREPEGPGGGWAFLQGGSWEVLHGPKRDWPWELWSGLLCKWPSSVWTCNRWWDWCTYKHIWKISTFYYSNGLLVMLTSAMDVKYWAVFGTTCKWWIKNLLYSLFKLH